MIEQGSSDLVDFLVSHLPNALPVPEDLQQRRDPGAVSGDV